MRQAPPTSNMLDSSSCVQQPGIAIGVLQIEAVGLLPFGHTAI
jgi:hypothetical protein